MRINVELPFAKNCSVHFISHKNVERDMFLFVFRHDYSHITPVSARN